MTDHQNVDLKTIAWSAMERYGFTPRFPDTVIREVNAISTQLFPDGKSEIKDLQSLLWSSIDNDDSQDLDQVEYCERHPGGEIRVRVAIADVDFFVPKHSLTDQHAASNGTSVYTGIETFTLLPVRLSHDITSLLPGTERKALVIEYTVLADGNVRPDGVYRALISNRAKLVYEEIGSWLGEVSKTPEAVRGVPGLEEQLYLQHEAATRLRRYRMEQGALELETLEPHPIIEDGMVKDVVVQQENTARHLIEEFMIAANGTMVAFLGNAGIPMIQRVVRVPKNWIGIVITAASCGVTLPSEPDSKALSKFLIQQKKIDPERFPDLSLTIVKLLGSGEYMTLEPGKPPYGHFGLAVTDYTHGTAPNRRYVDIIIQRLLKSVIDRREIPYTRTELMDLSSWLTDREKASKKVERFVQKAIASVFLYDRIGESFEGLVTGVTEHGTFIRVIAPPSDGKVVQGEQGLRVGQKVLVRLVRTDPYKGHIDFECVKKLR
jgi:exoribonuclease-2